MTNDEAKAKKCAELIEKSKEIIRESFKRFIPDDLAITWTGGKDSTTVLWIIRQVCLDDGIKIPKVMTIDEGDAFPEIHEFLNHWAKEWELDLEWCINQDVIDAAGGKLEAIVKVEDLNERNQAEIKRIGYDKDIFPFEAESYVGNHLMKTVVFNEYIERNTVKGIFQGLRRDEQSARKQDVGLVAIKPFMGGSLFEHKTRFPVPEPGDKEEHDLARLTLQCILTNEAITATIPGLSTIHEVDNAAKASYASRVTMGPAEKHWLEQMTERRWATLPQRYAWLRDWEVV